MRLSLSYRLSVCVLVAELQTECVCLSLSYRLSVCALVVELQTECVCACR